MATTVFWKIIFFLNIDISISFKVFFSLSTIFPFYEKNYPKSDNSYYAESLNQFQIVRDKKN